MAKLPGWFWWSAAIVGVVGVGITAITVGNRRHEKSLGEGYDSEGDDDPEQHAFPRFFETKPQGPPAFDSQTIDEQLLVAHDAIEDDSPESLEQAKQLMLQIQRYIRTRSDVKLTPEQKKKWEELRVKLYKINPKRTFVQARQEIFVDLAKHGWPGKPDLKIPWFQSPDGKLRLWFKPQAVWVTTSGSGDHHVFRDARTLSYDLDIRKMNPSLFRRMLARRYRIDVGGLDGQG
jgi:septum formation topological specificity factor MinE